MKYREWYITDDKRMSYAFRTKKEAQVYVKKQAEDVGYTCSIYHAIEIQALNNKNEKNNNKIKD